MGLYGWGMGPYSCLLGPYGHVQGPTAAYQNPTARHLNGDCGGNSWWGASEPYPVFFLPPQSLSTRREQARQLVIDLESRGQQAFPVFLSILRDTGQGELADALSEACGSLPSQPINLRPVELEPSGEKRGKRWEERGDCPVLLQVRAPWNACPSRSKTRTNNFERRLHQPWVYQLKADPCGHCLIINNIAFSPDSGLSTRTGSDVDCERLEKRFKSLCFRVQTLRDLKAQEINAKLRSLAQQDHSALDCCLVVILSHGCQAPSGNLDEPDAVASLPTPGDILVSYSTFPGFVSWRDKSSGSWYVETLDSVLKLHAHSEDLLTMLLRVANAVSAKGKFKQMPGCFNFLRKKFFFMCK
ncbi:Caspase-9 [Aix galericulata]|nr:Caspase-9 [Aix galericulata]